VETVHTEQPGAGLLASAWLAQNSHLGLAAQNATLHQTIAFSKPLTASGLPDPLYDFRVGPRCSGKERDAETGLDYFGARYFSGAQGRFTIPDPSPDGISVTDPQSWNLYSYVRNRPLRFVDVGGNWATEVHAQILTFALQGYVSAGELQHLIDRQYIQDKNWNRPQDQFMHAMSNGTTKPPQSSAEATTKMWSFVADDIQEANATLHADSTFSDRSLVLLGDAIHAVQDYTSPMHRTDAGEAIPWTGYSLGAVHHWAGESSPNRDWARIGWAVRLTMAAFMQANPEQAKARGLTDRTFEKEAQKRISEYVRWFSSATGANKSHMDEDRARQCALGNPAACQN